MARTKGQRKLVFETEPFRQKSRRFYVLLLRLTLVPLLTIMGFASGSMFSAAGAPKFLCVVASLVLGPLLPWLAWRGTKACLYFRFELDDDGLTAGQEGQSWHAPYHEVDLIECAPRWDEDKFVKVWAGPWSAKVLLDPGLVEPCMSAMIERCPCAVWSDEETIEHMPGAVESLLAGVEPAAGLSDSPLRNLLRLEGRHLRWALGTGLAAIACWSFSASYAWRLFGGAGKAVERDQVVILIASIGVGSVFGLAAWVRFRTSRRWKQECSRLAEAGIVDRDRSGSF